MKKFLFLPILILLSCGDGDIQIEALSFDGDPQNCGTLSVDTDLFFKINSNNEALILQLQTSLLKNEATTETIVSSVPGQSQLTYRIFSDNVTSDYFCSDIPPSTPIVTEEIEATAGEIRITTTDEGNGEFKHVIELNNITLLTGENERITDLTINEFGTITTKVD